MKLKANVTLLKNELTSRLGMYVKFESSHESFLKSFLGRASLERLLHLIPFEGTIYKLRSVKLHHNGVLLNFVDLKLCEFNCRSFERS